MLYGYTINQLDEQFLHLRDVTIDFQASDLHAIGQFLIDMANKFDEGTFQHSQYHISHQNRDWDTRHPLGDVIVMQPTMH